MYDGAPALGGADLTLDVELFVVVLLELDPDSYVVVAVEVYPPSIAVLDPDVLVCVDPAITAAVIQPDSNNNNVIREKKIDCPAKDQQFRLNDVRNAEAQEKVVGFEVIDGKCVEIWAKTDFVDKYLPSSSVVATTLVVTIVATSAATATPFLTRLLKPIFKQIINRAKKLIGKNQEQNSVLLLV